MLTEEAKGMFMVKELVEVEMLKIVPVVPVEILEIMLLMFMADEDKFLLASVTTKLEGVRVATFTLPILLMVNRLLNSES